MKRQFEHIEEIADRKTYDAAVKYLNALVDYASQNGYFAEQDAENEYTREFGRITAMTADYESIYMKFEHLRVKNPLLVTIEKEMRKKNLNQRQTAALLEVRENTFSQILSGKRNISMRLAKKLYQIFKIDPKTILDFA